MMNTNILTLNWIKCTGDTWCELGTVNLNHDHFNNLYGVYIIWYWDNQRQLYVRKVGQGEIRERLKQHRRNLGSTHSGHTLYVTWAKVSAPYRDGVEVYLGNKLRPQDIYPDVEPIPVNLPPW